MRNGEGEMADDQCRMADDKCRMAEDGCEVRSGGCGDEESGEPTPEVSQSPIVGDDSNRVLDDSTNHKIGIMSHEGMDATDRPRHGDCVRQSLPGDETMPQKAQNEANLESKQSLELQGLKSETAGSAGRKRSQSSGEPDLVSRQLRAGEPGQVSHGGALPVAGAMEVGRTEAAESGLPAT